MITLSVPEGHRIWAIPLAVVVTLVAAFTVRWLLRRAVDRGVRSVSSNTLSKHVARARAARVGEEVARLEAERSAARARTVGSLLKSAISIIVLFCALVIVLALFGVNVTPLLASAGIVGVAVGFGAQSLVKDFLTGMFMIFEDQYGVGDVIDTGVATGTVDEVGLRVTRLRDDDGVIWYVPNGSITRVGNKSQGFAKAVVDVVVPYGTDLPGLQTALTDAAEKLAHDPDWDPVILDQPVLVSVESMTEEQVQVRVTLRTLPARHGTVARELRQRLRDALDALGVVPVRPPRTPH